jgi:hypothetical protein
MLDFRIKKLVIELRFRPSPVARGADTASRLLCIGIKGSESLSRRPAKKRTGKAALQRDRKKNQSSAGFVVQETHGGATKKPGDAKTSVKQAERYASLFYRDNVSQRRSGSKSWRMFDRDNLLSTLRTIHVLIFLKKLWRP